MYAKGEIQLYVASTLKKSHNFLLSQQMVYNGLIYNI